MLFRLQKTYQRFAYHFMPSAQAWTGATIGVICAALILCLASAFDLLQNNVSFEDASFYFLGSAFFIALIGAVLVLLWLFLSSIPRLFKWACVCFALAVYYFFVPFQTTEGITVIAFWMLASFSLVGGSLAALLANRQPSIHSKLPSIAGLLIGILAMGLLGLWLFEQNSTFKPPFIFESEKPVQPLNLPDPAAPGPLSFSTLTYGSGRNSHRPEFAEKAALISPTVNGSAFVGRWDGFHGYMRTRYWGFDNTDLPLNGTVWLPKGDGPFPLVVIVHGNHEMSVPSDQGYAYLGELFASHGFLTVSIDENFLNGSWFDLFDSLHEVPARGWLILEHLSLWKQWNEDSKNPFYKKVDMDRIALIGHSRGGEAIATAAALNPLSHYPSNGNINLDYRFNIKALAAIAPVDSQNMPGGVKIKLDNIDYFVIQGSHDGDVRSFEGIGQYQRVFFNNADDYHFKSSLYIFGANHGQFNTLWGKKDNPPPSAILFDLEQIMPSTNQQQIAKVYLTAFLKASLQGQVEYLPLFLNYRKGQPWLPRTLYLNEFADSTYQYIEDEAREIDIAKTSLKGGIAHGNNLKEWRQSRILMKEGMTAGLGTVLGWDKPFDSSKIPAYTLSMPENALHLDKSSILVVSLANGTENSDEENNEDAPQEPQSEDYPLDFTIEMTDKKGEKATLLLSNFAYLQPSIHVKLMKADFLDPLASSEYIFQTFEFPLNLFMERNPHFNPGTLKTIQFRFDKSAEGLIILKSVAFRSPLPKKDK